MSREVKRCTQFKQKKKKLRKILNFTKNYDDFTERPFVTILRNLLKKINI